MHFPPFCVGQSGQSVEERLKQECTDYRARWGKDFRCRGQCYLDTLKIDVLALTETWGTHVPFISNRMVGSERPRSGTSPAAGVAIMLSPRMAKREQDRGSIGTRGCWCRLRGPCCSLLIIAAYLPYIGHKHTDVGKTLRQFEDFLTLKKRQWPHDMIIFMGDFNAQLKKNVKGVTGNYTDCNTYANKNGREVTRFLKHNDLFKLHRGTGIREAFKLML